MPTPPERLIVNDISAPSAATVGPQTRVGNDFFQARAPRRQIGAVDFASLSNSINRAVNIGASDEAQENREEGAIQAQASLELARKDNISTKQALASAVSKGTIEEHQSPAFWTGYRSAIGRDAATRAREEARISLQENLAGLDVDNGSGTPGVLGDPDALIDQANANALAAIRETDPEMADDFYFQRAWAAQVMDDGARLRDEYQSAVTQRRTAEHRRLLQGQVTDLAMGLVGQGSNPTAGDLGEIEAFQNLSVRLSSVANPNEIFTRGVDAARTQLARIAEEGGPDLGEDLMVVLSDAKFGTFRPADSPEFQRMWQEEGQRAEGRIVRQNAVADAKAKEEINAQRDNPNSPFSRMLSGEIPDAEAERFITSTFNLWTNARDEHAFEKRAQLIQALDDRRAFATRFDGAVTASYDDAIINGDEEAALRLEGSLPEEIRAEKALQRANWFTVGQGRLAADPAVKSAMASLRSLTVGTGISTSGADARFSKEVSDTIREINRSNFESMTFDGTPSQVEIAAGLQASQQRAVEAVTRLTTLRDALANDTATTLETVRTEIVSGAFNDQQLKSASFRQAVGEDTANAIGREFATFQARRASGLEYAANQSLATDMAAILSDPDHPGYDSFNTVSLTTGSVTPNAEQAVLVRDLEKDLREKMRAWQDSTEAREATASLNEGEYRSLVKQRWDAFAGPALEEARSLTGLRTPDEAPATDAEGQERRGRHYAAQSLSYARSAARNANLSQETRQRTVADAAGVSDYLVNLPDAFILGSIQTGKDVDVPTDTLSRIFRGVGLRTEQGTGAGFRERAGLIRELGRKRQEARTTIANEFGPAMRETIQKAVRYKDPVAGTASIPWYHISRAGGDISRELSEDGFGDPVALQFALETLMDRGELSRAVSVRVLLDRSRAEYLKRVLSDTKANGWDREDAYKEAFEDAGFDWRAISQGFHVLPTEGEDEGVPFANGEWYSPDRHRFFPSESGLKDLFREDVDEAARAFFTNLGIEVDAGTKLSEQPDVRDWRARQQALLKRL